MSMQRPLHHSQEICAREEPERWSTGEEMRFESYQTNDFDTTQLLRLIPGPVFLVLFPPPLWSPSADG